MAMTATFYHFSKRNRSTKVPEGSGTTLNIDLKDSTSVVHPIIIVQTIEAELFNYCFLSNFNRYYFISDWVYIKGRWECSLTLDPLATYKTSILSTSASILYAAGSTKNIADTRIPVIGNLLKAESYKALTGITFRDSGLGAIILGITGKGSFGAYLLANSMKVYDLIDGVDNWWTTTVSDTWDAFKQLIYGGTAGECLRSAMSMPILVDQTIVSPGQSAENLVLGNYPCKDANDNAIQGYKITNPIIQSVTNIDIPWIYSDWRRASAYTAVTLYIPCLGCFSLPASTLYYDSSLDIEYAINVTSGDIAAQVKGHTSEIIVVNASGNIAMPAPYGSTGINTSKLTTSFVAGVGATAMGVASAVASGGLTLPAVAAIGGGLAAGASGTIEALGGTAQGSAGLGGGASHVLDPVCHVWVTQKELTDTQANFNNIMGKPFMGVSTPGAFSGYVQTDGFQFANDFATSTEKDTINKLMDSGVYIE